VAVVRESPGKRVERRAARAQRIGLGITCALAAAAVATELLKPPGERRWHGRLGGFVPYDFRPPTMARIRHTWWSPSTTRILVDTGFGIGWDINLGRVARVASITISRLFRTGPA
jgi:hypothetical protein